MLGRTAQCSVVNAAQEFFAMAVPGSGSPYAAQALLSLAAFVRRLHVRYLATHSIHAAQCDASRRRQC